MSRRRWDPCVQHVGDAANSFFGEYFSAEHRKVLLVGAAGFDARSTHASEVLAQVASSRLSGMFIREERPGPSGAAVAAAGANVQAIRSSISSAEFHEVQIFAPHDQAVVAGRNTVDVASGVDFSAFTDVVVDCSAFSVGVYFPLVKYIMTRANEQGANLHVVISTNPGQDHGLSRESCDSVTLVHGFTGSLGLHAEHESTAWLWIPQLAKGRRSSFRAIHGYLRNHAPLRDTCPLLPFPTSMPRLPDDLLAHFRDEIEDEWTVDERNLLYAAEGDPSDAYQLLLRLDDQRRQVFEALGGSELVLSPLGSKVLALGCLMAALERDMPVAYVETLRYVPTSTGGQTPANNHVTPQLVHVWLRGEAYPDWQD